MAFMAYMVYMAFMAYMAFIKLFRHHFEQQMVTKRVGWLEGV